MAKLFDRIMKGVFGVTFGGAGAEQYAFSRSWVRGDDLADVSGGSVIEPFRQHPTVSLAIATIAADAAAVEWELYAGESEDPLEEHPILDLWRNPSPNFGAGDLWISTYTLFKIYGEVFWWYPMVTLGATGNSPRSAKRNTGELYVVHPGTVRVEVKDNVLRYVVNVNGNEQRLDPERLTHFKRFNPYNPLRGLSELDPLNVEVNADYNAATWNKTFFGASNGVPAGIIIPNKDAIINVEDREGFLARWNATLSRRKTAGMLPPGWDWKDVGPSQKEMDFRTLREYSRELILAGVGVPPFLSGVLDRANYANAREQKDVYWHGTITRLLSYFQRAINDDFLPKLGIENIEAYPRWETVKALTENLQEKMAIAQAMFSMGFTKRQINDRLELGMDVDTLEDADVGYLPFSVAPVEMILEPPPPPVAPAPPQNGEDEDEDESEEETPPPRRSTKAAAPMNETRRTLIWRNVAGRTKDLEARMNSLVRRHFENLQTEMLVKIEGMEGWRATRPGSFRKGIEDDVLFDTEDAKRKLAKAAEPIQLQAIRRGGQGVLDDMNMGIEFDYINPRVVAGLVKMSGKITRIDDTIEAALRASLAEGLSKGESPQELAVRVRDEMDAGLSRSMTIARTEVGSAYSAGRMAGMAQAGVKRHQWISARDERVRDAHAAGTGDDGVDVAVGEAFPHSGLLYPHDPDGAADQVINCRCVTIPFISEEPFAAGEE